MLDISFILENKDIVRDAILNKNKEMVDFDVIEKLYNERKVLVTQLNDINHKKKEAQEKRDNTLGARLKAESQDIENKLRETTTQLTKIISKIPNIPSPDTPVGKGEEDNVVLREVGEKREFSFTPNLIGDFDDSLIDSKRAVKISGSRFAFLKGDLVKMQFKLVNWVLSEVTNEEVLKEIIEKNNLNIPSTPFVPLIPPMMVTPETYFGMARLDPKEDKYYLPEDNLFLIGSAEHSIGSMHSGETFDEKDLPIRYIGYSTSFRREAGTYGKRYKRYIKTTPI